MYRSASLFIALLLLSSFYTVSPDQNQVIKAAQKGLAQYLALIPAGQEKQYGFSQDDNMQNCTMGKPFQMLSLSYDFYHSDYVPGNNYIVTGKVWRVPVISNGQYRTLLTVAGDQGNYNVVDIGGAGLATELQQISAKAGTNDNFYILRIHPLAADFFVDATTATIADASFIPLTSAFMAMPELKNKPAYSLGEVLAIIKTALAQPKN